MSFNKNEVLKADDINLLKSRLKIELSKRSKIGSVAEYAGDAYDFSTKPDVDIFCYYEIYQKTVDLLKKVNNTDLKKYNSSKQSIVLEMQTLDNILQILEEKKDNPFDANTGCSSSCTGFCYDSCFNECTATCGGNTCTGGCKGGCGGCGYSSCTGECQGGCTKECNSTCYQPCSSSCGSVCNNVLCEGGCLSDCYGTSCTGICKNNCWDTTG